MEKIILPADYPLANLIRKHGLLDREMVEVRLPDLKGLPAVLATYALDCAFVQRKGQAVYEELSRWELWERIGYAAITPTWLIALWRRNHPDFDPIDLDRDLTRYGEYCDVTGTIFRSIARDINWDLLEFLRSVNRSGFEHTTH